MTTRVLQEIIEDGGCQHAEHQEAVDCAQARAKIWRTRWRVTRSKDPVLRWAARPILTELKR